MSRRVPQKRTPRLCDLCGESFIPRLPSQHYCPDCHKPCPHCGGNKDVRAKMCKPCYEAIGNHHIDLKTHKICRTCGVDFLPTMSRQAHCQACIDIPCVDCGGKKKVATALRCRKCYVATQPGTPNPKNCQNPLDMFHVTQTIETLGLQSEKQYAFGYVIGTMLGDGSIRCFTETQKQTNSRGDVNIYHISSYRLRLEATSRAFVTHFSNMWACLTDRRPLKLWDYVRTYEKYTHFPSGHPIPEGYSSHFYVVQPRHRVIGAYLYRLKYETEPIDLLRFPDTVLRGILEGMIDSEGYDSPQGYLDIANKDRHLLDALVLMFARLGASARVYTSPSQSISHLRTRTTAFLKLKRQ